MGEARQGMHRGVSCMLGLATSSRVCPRLSAVLRRRGRDDARGVSASVAPPPCRPAPHGATFPTPRTACQYRDADRSLFNLIHSYFNEAAQGLMQSCGTPRRRGSRPSVKLVLPQRGVQPCEAKLFARFACPAGQPTCGLPQCSGRASTPHQFSPFLWCRST
jgi:hypothetical protein